MDLPQRPPDHGPAPMPWEDYVSQSHSEYDALLASDPAEQEMQHFFERNPAWLPGAFPFGLGHGAFPEALISQPHLAGIGDRRPDFMWIARNSGMVQPVLIEIERPSKPWIAGRGRDLQQSAELTQALNQLRQWEEWLEKPANQEILFERHAVPAQWRKQRALRPQYWLIYGRRAENPDEIARLRRYFYDRGLHVHSYDNLAGPNPWCRNYITVRGAGDRGFDAIEVPPTTRWIASSPESWAAVRRRADAVKRSLNMSKERKAALISQLPDWDAWATYWLERERA